MMVSRSCGATARQARFEVEAVGLPALELGERDLRVVRVAVDDHEVLDARVGGTRRGDGQQRPLGRHHVRA